MIDYENRKPKAINYNDNIRFRVSKEEKELISNKAKELELSITDLIRNSLMKTYKIKLYTIHKKKV